MSLFSARSRIIAIMPVRNTTIMSELMIENQCTSSSGLLCKYLRITELQNYGTHLVNKISPIRHGYPAGAPQAQKHAVTSSECYSTSMRPTPT